VGIMKRTEVQWEDESGTSRKTPAMLEDTSRGGACIRAKDPIAVGARVVVQWPNGSFSGTVRHCNRRGGEYVLGLQSDPVESAEK
jgi:hypothetical protein